MAENSNVDDPWLDGRLIEQEQRRLSFDDDFIPSATDNNKSMFVRMPDSLSYISFLEAKLAQLKSNGGLTSGKQLLDDLSAVKEGLMSRFMGSEDVGISFVSCGNTSECNGTDIDDNRPIEAGAFDFIKSRICPEKQAMTAEELLALVNCDCLNRTAVGTSTDQSESASTSDFVSVQSTIKPIINNDKSDHNRP